MERPIDSQVTEIGLNAWREGVHAVDASRLVEETVQVENDWLQIADCRFDLDSLDRIRVIGAGKASAGMVAGLQNALGDVVLHEKRVSGWVNVPKPVCANSPLKKSDREHSRSGTGRPAVWVFPARPHGENLPTDDAYGGTLLIKDIVQRTGENEICIGLFSGGGSSLLVEPERPVRICDKRELISWLGAQGANIRQLNTVRKQISGVKGGRLASSFSGEHFVSLLISDVIGDELDLIASGPTVQDSSTPRDALRVLLKLDPQKRVVSPRIWQLLESKAKRNSGTEAKDVPQNVTNVLIGSIETAVSATCHSLERAGFRCESEIQFDESEEADECGNRLAQWILERIQTGQRVALVSGGEPIVRLCRSPGHGGRNQQLVLAAMKRLLDEKIEDKVFFGLISGGTDGEDGNTAVAGAFVDNRSIVESRERKLDPAPYLRRNDAFSFFSEQLGYGGLAGPSAVSTNVGDLRVVLLAPRD